MTEKLFYKDAYLTSFTAVVQQCIPVKKGKKQYYRIVLDRSAFFPEGGGQYADGGTLGGKKVLDVQEEGGIFHLMEEPLEPGQEVEGLLDWTERFIKMQQHTGEHIVSGIVNKRFGYNNVGFHLGSKDSTMDFDGEITQEQLKQIEEEANRAAVADLEVQVSYPTHEELQHLTYRSKIEIEGQLRLVTIPGYDVCACCAPHLRRTGEIGMIRLTNVQHYKGGVRVTLLCGFRALADYREREEQSRAVSALLCAPESELDQAVQHLQQEKNELKQQLTELKQQMLSARLEPYLDWEKKQENAPERAWLFEEKLKPDELKYMMNRMLEKGVGVCVVISEDAEGGFRYIAGSRKTDVRPLAKYFNQSYDGRGGGKPEMVQGACKNYPGKETIQKETVF